MQRLGFLALIIIAYKIFNNISKRNRSANARYIKTGNITRVDPLTNAVEIKWHPDERERQEGRDSFKWSKDAPVWLGTLFALLALAISVASLIESQRTTHAIDGQLDEMTRQRLLSIAQMRGRLRLERPDVHPVKPDGTYVQKQGEQFNAFDINPKWTNVGNTEAINFLSFSEIFVITYMGKPIDCPKATPGRLIATSVVAKDQTITEVAKKLSVVDALAATEKPPRKIIILSGYAEYNDIFDIKLHRHEWCTIMQPNDLQSLDFSFLRATEKDY